MKKQYNSQIFALLAMILFSIQPLISNSQTFEWIRSQPINYNYNPDMINNTVDTDSNGDIIYAGLKTFLSIYDGMYGELFLKKYSAGGDEFFDKQISGRGMVDHLVAKSGKYYLCGEFKDSIYFQGHPWFYTAGNSAEFFLAIFNEDGTAESVFNLSEKFTGINRVGHFAVDDDNMLYFGMTISSDTKIVKMDALGNVVQTIEQTNVWLINNIDLDPAGNIIVAGAFAGTQCLFGGELFAINTDDNMYVAKYNPQGQVQWVRFIEDVIYTTYNQVKCDHDGNIYFSGVLAGDLEFGPFQANGPDWVYDFFLTKLNTDGEFQWLVEVPEDNNLGDASIGNLNFLEVDANNNVYVSGFIRGTIDWGNGVVSTGYNYYDLLLLSFSPDGIIQWSKSGGSDSFVKSVGLATDAVGNCYMAAVGSDEMTFDTIVHYQGGFVYPFLIKLSNDIFTGINSPVSNTNTFDIYPNPATDLININLKEETSDGFELSLFTVTGQKLMSNYYPAGTKNIQMELPPAKGLLFVEVIFDDGNVVRNKVLVY
jgi:hypothetical protein